jgi:hypothetical protein
MPPTLFLEKQELNRQGRQDRQENRKIKIEPPRRSGGGKW